MAKLYYNRNGIQIYHGDSVDWLPTVAPASVDLVATSPPYNCGKDYGEHDDSQDLARYFDWLESVLSAASRGLARHGYLCVNHGNFIGSRESRIFVPDELCPILSRCMPFRDWIIWDKGPASGAAWGNFRTSPRIRAQHENIYVHGGTVQMPPSDIEWDEWSKFTTSIWPISTAGIDLSVHPAMMPVEVARRLCLLYSPASGLVCDPFTGSGTTAIACIMTGRRFVGCELSEAYCESAARRCDRELDQGRLFGSSREPGHVQKNLIA
jgi:site-specific DNA-methyltransferase (adenine-specific)